MKSLKHPLILALISTVFFISGLAALANDFNFENIIGSAGLSAFELEMRESFLLEFCRHDKETNGQDVFQCLTNNGRSLKPEQREIMLAFPGRELRNDFFYQFEKEVFQSIGFEMELSKTPTGRQLIDLYSRNKSQENNIRFKLFYHVERAENLFSNMLTLERLNAQNHTHFGFTVSSNNKAIVGVNAFQSKEESFYTLLHELYHLYDPQVKLNPTPVEIFQQETRALLFELRIYIERRNLVSQDRYSFSKFHEDFLLKRDGRLIGVDWSKLGYYIHTRFFPKPNAKEFVFGIKDTDFLIYGASGRSEVKTLYGGLIFNDVLLELFKDELEKSKNEQDKNTIVARLLYSLPMKKLDTEKIEREYDITRRMFHGLVPSLSQEYGHLVDFNRTVPLRADGINELSIGGPRPRNEGGP